MASSHACSEAQTQEVQEVKTTHGSACRVLKDIGDYTHVVDIKLSDKDLTIKYQLEAQYPEIVPQIILRSNHMKADIKENLTLHLSTVAKGMVGKQMINALVKEAQTWLDKNLVELGASEPLPKDKRDSGVRKGKRKERKKNKSGEGETEEEILNEKKSSMKTSEDVISRILWDPSLPSEDFVIGYVDRFVGIVEKAFTAFSWEDLASVDYNTLAIPKHRIEYFKYKKVKVWEKKSRMDNIFGSTGSGKNIYDVIKKCEEEEAKRNEDEEAAGQRDQNVEDENDEDDDDDGVVINVGNQDDEGSDEYRSGDEVDSGATYRGTRMTKTEYFGPKAKPNHFLALKITNPEIISSIQEAQDLICNLNPEYHECLISVERLHITLACIGLDTPEQTEQAVTLLKALRTDLASWNPQDMTITLEETDQFYHNVLYAKVKCEQKFMDLVNHLRRSLEAGGVEIRDVYDFHPHMTMLKLDSVFKAKTNTRYLDARLYDLFKDKVFGHQMFDNIYLCEMSKSKQADGFYVSHGSLTF